MEAVVTEVELREPLRMTVKRLITEGRIGEPKSVRWQAHVRGSRQEAAAELAAMKSAAAHWLGGDPSGEHTVQASGEHTVIALRWAGGQSAILSVSASQSGAPGGSLVVMGSRGVLYFTPPAGQGEEA